MLYFIITYSPSRETRKSTSGQNMIKGNIRTARDVVGLMRARWYWLATDIVWIDLQIFRTERKTFVRNIPHGQFCIKRMKLLDRIRLAKTLCLKIPSFSYQLFHYARKIVISLNPLWHVDALTRWRFDTLYRNLKSGFSLLRSGFATVTNKAFKGWCK